MIGAESRRALRTLTFSTITGSPSAISTVMSTLSSFVVQLHVDADDLGVGIAAIGVVRLDAPDVAVELQAIEEMLARPWKNPALARGDDRPSVPRP